MGIVSAAITGNYMPTEGGEPDFIIGQSFGARDADHGVVNMALARCVANLAGTHSVPVVLQSEIADALQDLPGHNVEPDLVIRGEPSTAGGGELDSWEVLRAARKFMVQERLGNHPLLVAQAHHVGRVAAQAVKWGMDPFIFEGLPKEFDPESTQWWTRSRRAWVCRELPGLPYLKLKNKV